MINPQRETMNVRFIILSLAMMVCACLAVEARAQPLWDLPVGAEHFYLVDEDTTAANLRRLIREGYALQLRAASLFLARQGDASDRW